MNLNEFASTLVLVRKTAAHLGVILLIGMTSTLTATAVHATIAAPIANAGGPYSIHLGDSLVVNGSASSDPDIPNGDFISYLWDLGANGSADGTGITDTFSAVELASAGISSTGLYSLRLTVTDIYGLTDSQVTSLEVLALPAAVNAVPEPESLPLALVGLGLAGIFSWRRKT